MDLYNAILGRFTQRLGGTPQGAVPVQRYRDYYDKGDSYSVEAEIAEALADLILTLSTMPVAGESARAVWIDALADEFYRVNAKKLLTSAFTTGDAIVVPSYNGRNVQNIIVEADDFEVLETSGDEMTACAYVIERKTVKDSVYSLMQAVELVPYDSPSGNLYANRYRTVVARNGSILENGLSAFPEWKSRYSAEWYIPNVDRLLVARYKNFSLKPGEINSVRGVPLCYGAGEYIGEIHYLLDQMHNEFGLSEKGIIAEKKLFQREWHGDTMVTTLPKGKDRLFMVTDGKGSDAAPITEWSPEIRYQAYLDAIDYQMQRVESAVGVSRGIISNPNDAYYQNMDNVRKSQQKTMSFVSTARKTAEKCLNTLVYAWDVLANYYSIVPAGEYSVSYDWSNEYIESYSDKQQAILAGNAIGATDAADYRMFLYNESPEAAKERVAEIEAAKAKGREMMED